jgi:hypothetical protein
MIDTNGIKTTVSKNEEARPATEELSIEELKAVIAELRRQLAHQQKLILDMKGSVQQEHKDKLFKFIFGNPENKQWTLSLYNAVNGSNYTDPEEIHFNTLENILYVSVRNDVSFMFMMEMNLWEHQSTFNPNMPMRFFLYASRLYDKYVFSHSYQRYSSRLQPVPTPKCVCFYNGKDDQPERTVLRLSQAYDGDGDIEVSVTMLNINYGKNKALMEACEPLKEYSWFVDRVRVLMDGKPQLEAAVDKALDDMPDSFILKAFLLANKAEIKGMFLEDYNIETFKRDMRAEGYEEGLEEGLEKGLEKGSKKVAVNMLKDGLPIPLITKYSQLPEDTIKELAAKLNAES